jgi:hypothetical protein
VNLILKIVKYSFFIGANFLLLHLSIDIDVEQFEKDILLIFSQNLNNENLIFFLISNVAVLITFIMKQILKPFVEIFIEHYYKYGFYFLINILSISTTYIILRVYGYSRLNLLIYLLLSSITFEIFDRVERKV